jgi:hypothetical protein
MNPALIFLPVLALVLLTLLVWLRMYQVRIGEMRRKHIQPEQIATTAQSHALLTDTKSADNFSNLFELPMLFYAIAIILYLTQTVDSLQLILASAFVLGRYAHSFIATTYNKVMHRFYAYLLSSMLLWAMWLLFAIDVVQAVT